MNKRRLIILPLFLGLLLAGHVFAASQPPQKESKPKQTESPNLQRGTKESPVFIETLERQVDKDDKIDEREYRATQTTISHRNNIITTGLFLVALFQLYLFYWQLKLIRKSLADTEKAADAAQKSADAAERTVFTMKDIAQRQLRAYVCIPGATIKLTQKTDGMYAHVVLRYTNAGQTPGVDVTTWIALHIAEYPLRNTLIQPPPDARYTPMIINPGSEQYLVNEIIIKPEQHPIGTIKATLYVYGEILYRDVFGIDRFTKYRLLYGGDEGTFGTHLRPDLEGNETDYSQPYNQRFKPPDAA